MRGLGRRVARVAAVLGAAEACQTCRGWGPVVLCDDGGRCLRPEICPACGRHVPITRPLIIVGLDLDRL